MIKPECTVFLSRINLLSRRVTPPLTCRARNIQMDGNWVAGMTEQATEYIIPLATQSCLGPINAINTGEDTRFGQVSKPTASLPRRFISSH